MNWPVILIALVAIALIAAGLHGLLKRVVSLEAEVQELKADRHVHKGMTRVSMEASNDRS